MTKSKRDIRNEGPAWRGEEAFERHQLKPHQLGDPEVWCAAVAKFPH